MLSAGKKEKTRVAFYIREMTLLMTECAIESERKQHTASTHAFTQRNKHTNTSALKFLPERKRELSGCYVIAIHVRARENGERARERDEYRYLSD